jgi:hypothetical protein
MRWRSKLEKWPDAKKETNGEKKTRERKDLGILFDSKDPNINQTYEIRSMRYYESGMRRTKKREKWLDTLFQQAEISFTLCAYISCSMFSRRTTPISVHPLLLSYA